MPISTRIAPRHIEPLHQQPASKSTTSVQVQCVSVLCTDRLLTLRKLWCSTPSTLNSPSSVCHLHDSIRNPPLILELPWPDLTERALRVAASVATAAAAYACLGKIDAEARISCISPAASTQNLGTLFSCFTLLRYTSRATLWLGLRGLVSAGHCSRFFFSSTPPSALSPTTARRSHLQTPEQGAAFSNPSDLTLRQLPSTPISTLEGALLAVLPTAPDSTKPNPRLPANCDPFM